MAGETLFQMGHELQSLVFETLFPTATLTSHFFTSESVLHHIMFNLSETDADGFTLQVHETLAWCQRVYVVGLDET